MIRILLITLILFLGLPPQGAPKVEPVAALSEATVAESVRLSLEAKGLRVSGVNGKPICEVWFRKDLATETREVLGAVFPQIPEGILVGVIHFPEPNTDFRGQPIKAGFYTLRYALILEDGNHQGVSSTKDFLLLCPVAGDKDANVKMATEQLLKLSRIAAASGHPSPWSLVPVSDEKTLPKVIKNEHDHIILETRITTKSGPLAIGLIVFGKTEG
ncbi:MAG: hypothetical protein ABI882_00910 [Acidobacteriota bacterium]